MKKVLFCLQTMVLGGVETELITILSRFDKTEYDISLLVFYEQDKEILTRIPDGVKLINLGIDKNYYCSGLSTLVKKRLSAGRLLSAAALMAKRALGSPVGANVDISGIPAPNEEYDIAVCYHMHSPTMLRYVADKVSARKKLAWIHNDFSTTHYRVEKYLKWLCKYDKIAAVSERLHDELCERCPTLSDRALVIHNIVDEELIIRRSRDKNEIDERFASGSGLKLLTVGRMVEQKGYDIAVNTAKILRDRGLDFTWYVIGYGTEEENIKELVKQNALDESFVILGRKNNPYPYMRACDLYVQPSRHEGYPITLCEALALNKTVVCTNFAGAAELVEREDDGVVVATLEPSDIATEIEKYILSPERLKKADGAAESRSLAGWKKIEALFIED